MANLATMKVVALILLACCPAVAAIQASSKVGRISCGEDQIEEKQIEEKIEEKIEEAQGSSLANVDQAEQQLQPPGKKKCGPKITQQFCNAAGVMQTLGQFLGQNDFAKLQLLNKQWYEKLVPETMTKIGQIPSIALPSVKKAFPLVDDYATLKDAEKVFPAFRFNVEKDAKDAFFAVKVAGAILFGFHQQKDDVEINEDIVADLKKAADAADAAAKDADASCDQKFKALKLAHRAEAAALAKAAETALKAAAETALKAAETKEAKAEAFEALKAAHKALKELGLVVLHDPCSKFYYCDSKRQEFMEAFFLRLKEKALNDKDDAENNDAAFQAAEAAFQAAAPHMIAAEDWAIELPEEY